MNRPSLASSLGRGFLTGFVAGQLFLLIGALTHGPDLVRMSPSHSYAAWIFIRSVAIYGMLGAAVGVAVSAALHAVFALFGRGSSFVFPLVCAFMVSGIVFAHLTVGTQIVAMSSLPLDYPERIPAALRDLAYSVAVGAVVAVLAYLVVTRVLPGKFRPARWAIGVGVLSLAAYSVCEFALRLRPAEATAWRPSQVVVVGVDAVTLRVMGPMLRAGKLPTFQRLIDEGAWGTFLTYGVDSSPVIWTSMATGKRVRDHGIYDFVDVKRGSSGAEPMKSYDRRVLAVWNILGAFGLRVGVVDWLITYPPEEINGYMVTRLHMEESNRTYPPELNEEVQAILASSQNYGDPDRNRLFTKIDHVFDVGDALLDKEPLDLLLLFEAETDDVEHRYWKYYEPERFDPEVWDFDPQDVERLGNLIPDTYEHVDQRLGKLMARLDEDALLMVVSDHGQLAATAPQVWFKLDKLLEELGFLCFSEADPGKTDFSQSRAYSAVESRTAPEMGININVRGREPNGTVDSKEAETVAQELMAKLRAVRFEDGTSLFGPVHSTKKPDDSESSEADIVVTHSRSTRAPELGPRTILVDGREYRLSDFQDWNRDGSGGHDRQGVIFLHGRGVKKGPIGQRVVSTDLQELLWRLTDKVDAVDSLLPAMRRMGLIERATTLDLTPTILHALGLPVAEDMSGRALEEVVSTGSEPERIASYETGDHAPGQAAPADSDEELVERLRSLGYVR